MGHISWSQIAKVVARNMLLLCYMPVLCNLIKLGILPVHDSVSIISLSYHAFKSCTSNVTLKGHRSKVTFIIFEYLLGNTV